MAFDDSRALLRDLLLETKDGEWGKDQPSGDRVEMLVIRGTDFPHVRVGDLSSSPTRHIARKAALRKTLEAGDILIETAGGSKGRPTGRTIYISKEILNQASMPVTCASFARFLRVDPNLAEPEFVFWFLQALYASGAIEKHQVQHSGIARFQYTKFASEVEILLPPRSEQMDIARTMGAFDDKIALLRETNATLEAIAQALFKSWFVDFDPVRAKAEGRDPDGVPPEVADLFPSEFEDSELGAIPKGWKVRRIADCCDLGRGASPRPIQEFMGEDMPWVKIADATASVGPFIFETKEKIISAGVPRSVLLQPGALILSNSATCGVPMYLEIQGCIHDGWLFFKNYRFITDGYLFHALKEMSAHLVHIADGSVQKNLNTSLVGNAKFVVPPLAIVASFQTVIDSIFERLKSNCRQALALTDIRDTLLPRLMSGKLQLKEVGCELSDHL